MKEEYDFVGKWSVEGKEPSEFTIQFEKQRDELKVTVYRGESVLDFTNLKLEEGRSQSDECRMWFFSNTWLSRDGSKIFTFESQFLSDNKKGTFINAQEYRFIESNRIEQRLMGYRFDPDSEAWVKFEKDTSLVRLE